MIKPKPIFVINFKVYKETIGKNALGLARICEKVAIQTGADIRIAVAATDLALVAEHVTIPVYAEHVDEYPLGKHTGAILPEMIKAAGAKGTLINHSEYKIPIKKLEDSIQRAKELSLVTIACADSLDEERKILSLAKKPDFLAIEPPELIGGDISVSSAKPELITTSVAKANKLDPPLKVLVGAGVKSHVDVRRAIELGAVGVLVASGIDLAKDPESTLKDLIS